MKAFMDEQFLLSTQTAQKLFHNYAEHMPILDYHCHINPQEIIISPGTRRIAKSSRNGRRRWRR